MRKANHKGFTLIELLIAVTILAIVVTPMLNSFVSSYRMNSRSRQVMEATTLAQREMEVFEKESVEVLSTSTKYVYDGSTNKTGYQVTPADTNGKIQFKRIEVTNGSSSGSTYDVYVELDPSRSSATDRYYTQNTTPVLEMNNVGMVDTATFVQTIRTVSNPMDMDTNAYTWFYNHKLPTCNWRKEQFEKYVKRVITLDVEQYNQDGKTYTRVKVKYDYSLERADVMKSEHYHYIATQKVIFDNAFQKDADNKPIDLEEVYLFYGPTYVWDSDEQMDEIIINNTYGLPIDIYILRQDILLQGATSVNDIDRVNLDYKPKIKITDKVTNDRTAAVYHTNLNIDNSISDTGGLIQLSFKDAALVDDLNTYTRDDILEKTGLTALNEKKAKDRIYEMTVKVYKHDADVTTESPLVVLSGTKLN